MRLDEHARFFLAFGTLLILAFAARWLAWVAGPDVPTVVAAVMAVGALPALMLHWVAPSHESPHVLALTVALAIPGSALALHLWDDWLLARGAASMTWLAAVALTLAFVQAVALCASSKGLGVKD